MKRNIGVRCFINMSYIGTQFRGAQRLWSCKIFQDADTIEGNLELAFQKSPFKVTSFIELSSRTDAGVHALNNTAHVDVIGKDGSPVDFIALRHRLNKYFIKNNLAITINGIKQVHPDFHCRRSAKSRTYLYRLAVPKSDYVDNPKYITPNIEEWKRSFTLKYSDWDVDKFREGAALLTGRHDFESFRKVNKTGLYQDNIKTLYSIDVHRSSSIGTSLSEECQHLDYYDVVFKGKSFVHNQIRRMISVLNAVAYDKLTLREIKTMLQVPAKYSWPSQCSTAPAWGLYLCDVEYNPSDLLYTPQQEETSDIIDVTNQENNLVEDKEDEKSDCIGEILQNSKYNRDSLEAAQ